MKTTKSSTGQAGPAAAARQGREAGLTDVCWHDSGACLISYSGHNHGMGKIRRGGYIIFWWKGDHEPPHVHVKTAGGRSLGRVNLITLESLEGDWTPSRKLISIIEDLKREYRL